MNPCGHIAAAYLLSRRPASSVARALAPACVGALLPDVIDKSAMLGGLTPYGRTVGHSLTLWSFTVGFALFAHSAAPLASQTRWLTRFCAGGLSHLAVDLADDVVEGLERSGWAYSGWLGWPHSTPDDFMIAIPHLLDAQKRMLPTSLEVVFVCATLALLMRDARQRTRAGTSAK